jgi:hypothetical protein
LEKLKSFAIRSGFNFSEDFFVTILLDPNISSEHFKSSLRFLRQCHTSLQTSFTVSMHASISRQISNIEYKIFKASQS